MKKLLIVDTSSLLYQAKYGLGKSKLSYKQVQTGLIFGFLMKLQLIMNNVKPDLSIFALDSLKSRRLKIFPDYKKVRKKTSSKDEEKFNQICYEQFNIITSDILPKIGYCNIFQVKGLEADDIIASLCKKYVNNNIVIASNDGDLYQLLNNQVCMFNTSKNNYYTKNDFIKQYDIQPHVWKRIKCYAGCVSDQVPGVKGVGIITAIKFHKNQLNKRAKTYQALTSTQGKQVIRRNKRLVVLPFKGTPRFKVKPNKVTKQSILDIAEKYDIKSIQADINSWYYKLRH